MAKNWDARVSIFGIDFSIPNYFKPVEKIFGHSHTSIFVDHRNGMSAGYMIEEDIDGLTRILLDKIAEDENVVFGWCEKLKKETDKVNIYYQKPAEWFLNEDNMKEFHGALMEFGVYQVAVKELPNKLNDKLLKKFEKSLEDARKYCEHIFHEIENVLNRPLRVIAEKTGNDLRAIASMTYSEYLNYLKTGKLPDEKALLLRFKHCGLYYNPNLTMMNGSEAKEIIDGFIKNKSEGNVLHGQVAFKGKIRGVCNVVDNENKFSSFKEGEILVAGMTNPSFLPIMKKASAIITDAGGVLCHAAIVARELKIPCVIGTKIATQILKTGDKVRIDAEKGEVKILEGK